MNLKLVRNILVPIFIILIWWIVFALKITNPLFLPSPFKVLVKMGQLIIDGSILLDTFYTIYRTFVAFLISILLGVSLGLIIGINKRLYESLEFTIDFLRSIPATALFPLFILFFGVGDFAKISVAIFSSSLIILINTALGVRNSEKNRLQMATVFGANSKQKFIKIILPEALPQIFVGLRTAISIALIIIVVTEMFIGTNVGLGYKIYDAQLAYRTAEMYSAILLTGIIGYLLNKVFVLLETKIIHWQKY